MELLQYSYTTDQYLGKTRHKMWYVIYTRGGESDTRVKVSHILSDSVWLKFTSVQFTDEQKRGVFVFPPNKNIHFYIRVAMNHSDQE
jgi:hypothetical protein